MSEDVDYKGDKFVVLPKDFLNSVEAAVDLHADQISSVAANLYVRDINLGFGRRLIRLGAIGTVLWLVPVIWMICV